MNRTRIVQIGNSLEIRVPRVLIEQAHLPDEVTRHAEPGRWSCRPPEVHVSVGCSRKGDARARRRSPGRRTDADTL